MSLIFLQQLELRREFSMSCMPVRTKISSTSLTAPRSSRMAAATVCISLTLGADELFARLLELLVGGQHVVRRNERARRDPRAVRRRARDVEEKVVQQFDRRRVAYRGLAAVAAGA